LKKPKENKWFIAYKKRGSDLYDLSNLTIIEPATDTYEADPFIFKKNGRTFLFFELYDYEKGILAARELYPDGTYSKPKIVLEKPYHISFPSVIEIDGDIYMTPEEVLSGTLNIYRAKQFPYEWELLTEVAEGRYADPILQRHNGFFYIYTTEADNVLKVFRSHSLFGPWDVDTHSRDSMRNAGLPFKENGVMIRPVQECFKHYGRAIHFQRMTDFQNIRSIEPDWYPELTGTHTFNFNDEYVVLDGRIKL
jgi:hypothetical protein